MNLPKTVYLGDSESSVVKYVSKRGPVGDTSKEYQFTAKSKVLEVEDGDTWKGIRKPDPYLTMSPEYYRLTTIDTHESGGEHAEKAKREKEFTKQFVKKGREEWQNGEYPFVVVFNDPQGEYRGGYNRPLVDLLRRSDGTALSDALVDEFGEGVVYKPNQ